MPAKIRIFNKRYPLIPFSATLIGIVLLTMLGNWQVRRLGEKHELISSIERSMIIPAQQITADNVKNIELFQKIKLTGSFAKEQNIFLYGKRSGTAEKDGYYILTPFIMTEGDKTEKLLVSRGWIPQSLKENITSDSVTLPNAEQTIEAVVMPGEHKQFLTPENDVEKNIWFRIDPEFAAKTHNITVNHVYFRQISAQNLPEGMIGLNTANLSRIRNDHLEYALSWYGLAISLFVMFVYYYRTNS